MTTYLLAHGSADPRHAEDVAVIAERLGGDVRACYLDHCGPPLAEVADRPGIVVPLLFSPGYHVRVDVGAAIAETAVPMTLAEPPLLTSPGGWINGLLAEVKRSWPGSAVAIVTAGSRDDAVLRLWEDCAAATAAQVAHASGPGARLSQLTLDGPTVAVPLLVARGYFGDTIAASAADLGIPVAALAGTSDALIAELARLVEAAQPAGT